MFALFCSLYETGQVCRFKEKNTTSGSSERGVNWSEGVLRKTAHVELHANKNVVLLAVLAGKISFD